MACFAKAWCVVIRSRCCNGTFMEVRRWKYLVWQKKANAFIHLIVMRSTLVAGRCSSTVPSRSMDSILLWQEEQLSFLTTPCYDNALHSSVLVIHEIDTSIVSNWRGAHVRRCRRCRFMASGRLFCRVSAGELLAHSASPNASTSSPHVVAIFAGWGWCRLDRSRCGSETYSFAWLFLSDAGSLIHKVSWLISCKSPCSVRSGPFRRCSRV